VLGIRESLVVADSTQIDAENETCLIQGRRPSLQLCHIRRASVKQASRAAV